jgi:hypothetical protein
MGIMPLPDEGYNAIRTLTESRTHMMDREIEQRLGKEITQNAPTSGKHMALPLLLNQKQDTTHVSFKGSERHQDYQVSSHSTTTFIFRKPAARLFGRCCWTCVSVLHSDCIQSSALPMFV